MLRLRTLPRDPRPDTWTPGPPAAPVSAPEFLPRTRRSRGLRCYVPINTQFPPMYLYTVYFRARCLSISAVCNAIFCQFSACGCCSGLYLACGPERVRGVKVRTGDDREREKERRERERVKNRERERESLDALFQCRISIGWIGMNSRETDYWVILLVGDFERGL